MSTIGRARDALNRFNSTEVSDMERTIHLEKQHAEFAAAVDRAAKLADKLKTEGQRLGNSAYVHERAEGAGYAAAAAQLVAALEGGKE